MNYVFGYSQSTLVEMGLNLEEALLLKYLQYRSGHELTYKQILNDLPILHIAERQLSRLLESLIAKDFISKIKTKYGFILETRQKCQVLISSVDKNVKSIDAESRQKCQLPNYIYNTIENINRYKRYTECSNNSTSNIIDLIDKWHNHTQRDIVSLPSEGYDRIFDINELLSKIQQSRIAINFPFKVVIKKYDEIMSNEFKDFTASGPNKYVSHRQYTQEQFDSIWSDLDAIDF